MQDPSETNQKLIKENALLKQRIKEFEQSETEHKRVLDELRKLASVVRYSREIILLTAPDGRMVFLNEAAREKLGITEEDIAPVNIMQIVPKHLKDKIRQEVLPSIEKDGFWEGDLQYLNLKTAVMLDVHSIAYNITDPKTDKVQFLATVSRNITERKRIEKALMESEQLLKATQKLTKVGGWEWDVITQTATWTDEVYQIHDVDPADFPPGSNEAVKRCFACYRPEDRPIIHTVFRRCADHGEPYNLELSITTAKGRHLWIRTATEAIMVEGRVVKVIGNILDITEQKRIEEALKKSERLLNETQKLTKVGGWSWDVSTRTATWTDECFRIHDIEPVEFPPDSYEGVELALGCCGPEERSILQAAFQRCEDHGEPFDLQLPFTSAKGRRLWVRTKAEAEMVEGRVSKIFGNIMDITDSKRIEEALRERERLLNATQKLTKVGGWEWDVATQTGTWTDQNYRIHDFDPDDFPPGSDEYLIEQSLACYGPENGPVILAAFQRCVEHGEPYNLEFPFTTAKGRKLWIRNTAEAVMVEGRVVKVIGNTMDITDQKRIEEALKESERILNATQKLTKVGGWEWDVSTQTAIWTDELYRIYDIDPVEFPPDQLLEPSLACFGPEGQPVIQAAFQRCIDHGEPYVLELPFTTAKGRNLWIRTVVEAEMVEGRVSKIIGYIMDITEQKRIEEALRENERILNATQKLTKVGGWQWDVTTQTSFWTDECFRIHDIDPLEFPPGSQEGIERGLGCFEPEDRLVIQTAFQRCVEHGEPYNLELPFTSTKGRHLWIRTAAEAIMVEGRVVKLIGNFMDITGQKQAEQEREALIAELQNALANIKILRGLMPICASCKKIRNDQGYWQQIESYIKEHTDAEFSHAVCPECAKLLYPEYYKELYPEHDKS